MELDNISQDPIEEDDKNTSVYSGLRREISSLASRVKEMMGCVEENKKWTKNGFLLEDEIQNRDGPLIEIGGPTEEGFELVDMSGLNRKVYQSNICPGSTSFDTNSGKFLGYIGQVDFQANAQNLPIRDGSVGVLFASYLPVNILTETIREAMRVLEGGGLLVLQGLKEENVQFAKSIGFELVQYSKRLSSDNVTSAWSVVLKK